MSEECFVELATSKPNYKEPEGNLVVFRDRTAIILDAKHKTHIKTVVERNNPKKDWKEL